MWRCTATTQKVSDWEAAYSNLRFALQHASPFFAAIAVRERSCWTVSWDSMLAHSESSSKHVFERKVDSKKVKLSASSEGRLRIFYHPKGRWFDWTFWIFQTKTSSSKVSSRKQFCRPTWHVLHDVFLLLTLGWRPSLLIRLEVIASRLESIAIRLIASRLEAMCFFCLFCSTYSSMFHLVHWGRPLFEATAEIVGQHYRGAKPTSQEPQDFSEFLFEPFQILCVFQMVFFYLCLLRGRKAVK